MKPEYKEWIEDYIEGVGDTRGQCDNATNLMRETYPELIRKRGHVVVPFTNKRSEHWWLEDPDGEIVDPTEIQFGCILDYLEHDESEPEPIGKCLQCGAHVFPGSPSRNACSIECSEKFKETLNPKIAF